MNTLETPCYEKLLPQVHNNKKLPFLENQFCRQV